jgi:prepilin-type N-terminal cleavage/methylation domain-containing protein
MNKRGFTVVELLIVIVVIGVLAAISLVAYNGVQKRAETAARYAEVVAWRDAFLVYEANKDRWPPGIPPSSDTPNPPGPDYYCLGDNFPNGNDGQPRCRDKGGQYSYLQSKSTALLSELRVYSTIVKSEKKYIDNRIGPWARVYADATNTLEINQVFPGNITCPGELATIYSVSAWTHCQLKIDRYQGP